MTLGWIIFLIVLAIIVLIVISYAFRDSFFLFEGICVVCDAIGEGTGEVLDSIGDNFDGD